MTSKELLEQYYLNVRHKEWQKVDELIEKAAKQLEALETSISSKNFVYMYTKNANRSVG